MSEFLLYNNTKNSNLNLIKNKTLFVKLGEDHVENQVNARVRMAISDWKGALLYINEAIKMNKYVKDYYILKMEIYLNISYFEYAIVNFLKAYFLENRRSKLEESKAGEALRAKFILMDKLSRDYFQTYLKHYIKILNKNNSIDEFAIQLAKRKFYNLDIPPIKKNKDCDLFLALEEIL